jgi:hypothetical protein
MINFVTYVKDVIGNNYLAIKFDKGTIETYLNQLKEIIGEKDFENFTENQQKRDGGSHHMTVINVMDYNKLSKEFGMDKFVSSLDSIFKYEIDDLKFMGIGTAERNTNRAYFIVAQSDKLDAIRTRYGLKQHDFHITLGFNHKDVFGVRKNEVVKKEGKFLKLLKQEFYKSDNWNFIRKIENFQLDPKSEIIPVSISDSHLKVKCDGQYMDIAYLDDGEKFWIVTNYPIEEELPRMSETEISKKLKNK